MNSRYLNTNPIVSSEIEAFPKHISTVIINYMYKT